VQASPFLLKLRSETASSHQALEENPSSQFLMSDEVTVQAVEQYLKTMYGFVKGFEKVVFPILNNKLPQLASRKKTHLLTTDLLLSAPDIDRLNVLPDSVFTNYYTNSCTAWGGMYVLEGSALGGQIITKHLQRILGKAITNRIHYLTPYGAETGSMWKTFLHHFSEAAATKCDQEEIIKSAVQTFSLMNSWMTSSTTKIS
jgi:heme oxygenase (biliverdin-IX-beta and delta-forming)